MFDASRMYPNMCANANRLHTLGYTSVDEKRGQRPPWVVREIPKTDALERPSRPNSRLACAGNAGLELPKPVQHDANLDSSPAALDH